MSYSGNKAVKLFVMAVAVTSILLGSFGVNQSASEDKKPTVELMWEKKMDIEPTFLKQYEYNLLAENYFKAQERILSGQVGEQENVIVVVPDKEVKFMDKQGKLINKIPLQWDENINPETGIGKWESAFLSTDGKYVGISRFSVPESTFELLDVSGNALWKKTGKRGSIYSKAFITSDANNVVLFVNQVENFPGEMPDTLQFFSKNGSLLKEYAKPEYEMDEIWMDKQDKINVRLERGKTLFYTRLGANGDLIWERDISGFSPTIFVSASGEYYLLRKREGNEIYDYLFNKDGALLQKNLVLGSSWLSSDGDFRGTRTGDQIEFTSLSTGASLFNVDSRRLPGEEKTNTVRTSSSIHPSGQYILISLVKEKDAAPGWVVILDNSNKKVKQITFSQGNIKANFSGNGKFIRVFNYAENKIMLYKFNF